MSVKHLICSFMISSFVFVGAAHAFDDVHMATNEDLKEFDHLLSKENVKPPQPPPPGTGKQKDLKPPRQKFESGNLDPNKPNGGPGPRRKFDKEGERPPRPPGDNPPPPPPPPPQP